MAEREIRIRGANCPNSRRLVLTCMDEYERERMNDGRGEGLRNCVVWRVDRFSSAAVCVYHTRTAIVGVYQEAANG